MIHPGLAGALARLRGLDALLAREAAPLPAPQAATAGAGARAAADALPDPHAALPLPAGAEPDAPTAFTGAARFAASLPHAAPADIAARAALGVDAGPTALVALRLASDVAASGLFYEAHLAEWVAGERGRDTLLREPQAAWLRDAAAAPRAAEPMPVRAPAADAQRSAAGAALVTANVPDAAAQAADAAADAPFAAAAAPASPSPVELPVLRAEAREVVAQQLAVLEQRRFNWTGEAWPGQRVAVAFEEEPVAHEAATPRPPRRWTVRIATTLPTLGRIESTLTLDGTTLDAALAAEAPEALDALLGTRTTFDAALAGAGVRLARLALDRHDA